MRRRLVLAAATLMLATPAGADVTSWHVTYLDPANPEESLFVVDEWPSFLFLPNAPIYYADVRHAALIPPQEASPDPCATARGPLAVAGPALAPTRCPPLP